MSKYDYEDPILLTKALYLHRIFRLFLTWRFSQWRPNTDISISSLTALQMPPVSPVSYDDRRRRRRRCNCRTVRRHVVEWSNKNASFVDRFQCNLLIIQEGLTFHWTTLHRRGLADSRRPYSICICTYSITALPTHVKSRFHVSRSVRS